MQSQPTPSTPGTSTSGASVKKMSPRLAIVFAVVIALFTLGLPFFLFWLPDLEQNRLIETGTPAEAKILSADPTGNIYNDQPQIKLLIEVYPENQPTFQAEVKMVINPIYTPQFQPGNYVQVRYNPDDLSKVAVEKTLGARE